MPLLTHSRPAESTRILLVDSNLPIRTQCATLLQQAGYRVDAANDAANGWAAIRASGYDLLVIDYLLPGGSGLRLISRIRTARVTVPIILIAGTVSLEDFAGTARFGLAATLNRPFTADELLATAIAALQSRRQRSEREDWSTALICCAA